MVSGFCEKCLKGPVLVLLAAFCLLAGAPVRAAEAQLAVGQVRDTEGLALEGATVTAQTASGASAGAGTVDRAGGFAFELTGPATQLHLTCRYCRPVSVPYHSGEPAVIIAQRYASVASIEPSARDFAVLPYDRLADAIALRPFVVPLQSGSTFVSVSDRGLNAGHGLLLDAGVPSYDRSNGSMNLWSFPSRYVRNVNVEDAHEAFRYGSYAGGGTFEVRDLNVPADPHVQLNIGAVNDGRFAFATPWVAAAYGTSQSDTGAAARADVNAHVRIGAGELAFDGATSRSEAGALGKEFVNWGTRSAILRYAVASERYRAEAFIGAEAGETITGSRDSWSGGGSGLRVERAGTVHLELGFSTRVSRNHIDGSAVLPTQSQNDLYVAAEGGSSATRVRAALAALDVAIPGTRVVAVTPEVTIDQRLGAGWGVHAGTAGSVQPVLPIAAAAGFFLLRNTLYDGELVWQDVRRVNAAVIGFSETEGSGVRRYGGWGIRAAYQVTPEIALRAWALRGSATLAPEAFEYGLPYSPYRSAPALTAREVAWLTYDRPGGIRVDAIYSRNVATFGNDRHLDADVLVPLTPALRLYGGTSYVNRQRRYEFGLRF